MAIIEVTKDGTAVARAGHRDRTRCPGCSRAVREPGDRLGPVGGGAERRHSRGVRAVRASRSACVPDSTTRPRSITTMRSAARAVGSRCATRIVVRSAAATCIARCTARLARRGRGWRWPRRAAGSPGRRGWARARAISWRWPAESDRPRSLTAVQVAVAECGDELVSADGACRRLDLGVGRVGPAVGDVVADRAGEQERLLRHDRRAAGGTRSGRCRAGRCRRPAHRAARRVVEAGDELHDRRLPRARLADEGDGLAGLDVEVDAGECLAAPAPGSAKMHVVEARPRRSGGPGATGSVGRRRDRWRGRAAR